MAKSIDYHTTTNWYCNSHKTKNPYRPRHGRQQKQTLLLGATGLLLLVLLVIVVVMMSLQTIDDSCQDIPSLLVATREHHTPRWMHAVTTQNNNNRTGGVVLFWHLAKTGGSSIRGNFAKFSSEVDYRPLLKRSDWFRVVSQIESRLMSSSKTRRILFVELHGQGTFPNQHWDVTLQQWRDLADMNHKHFFVFTVLREPLSHTISYYNYFHKSHSIETMDMETMLKDTFMANRQCTTLAQLHDDDFWFYSSLQGALNAETCAKLYSKLLQHLDWIGTTETLSNETLPLVHTLLTKWTNAEHDNDTNVTAKSFVSYNVGKPHDQSIQLENLSETTRQYIQQRTCLDKALWQQVQRDYPITKVMKHYVT